LDFYRRITVGTAGTAMPPYEHALSAEDRWAVALYASVLRLPRPGGDVPAALRSFPTSARMSDSAVLAALGPGADRARLAAVRTFEPEAGHFAAAVFSEVRRQLDSAYDLARAGRAQEARTTAMDAYVTFEQIERKLRVKDPALTAEIEAARDRKSTRLNSSHVSISYAVFCLKKKKKTKHNSPHVTNSRMYFHSVPSSLHPPFSATSCTTRPVRFSASHTNTRLLLYQLPIPRA